MSYQNANGRTWEETVIARGLAILSRLVMPIVHDFGDEYGRATKFSIGDVIRLHDGRFRFVLYTDNGRGLLIGPKHLHLSGLQVVFSAAVMATFPRDDRPKVVVGIYDPKKNRVLMPQNLVPESELEPLEELDEEETFEDVA
jgi:hypothetical protein